jgi:hypothetical protein
MPAFFVRNMLHAHHNFLLGDLCGKCGQVFSASCNKTPQFYDMALTAIDRT